MKRFGLLIIMLISQNLHGSGFNDSVLWIYDIQSSTNAVSTGPLSICEEKFQTRALYTKPYQISQLRWNDFYAVKGFGRWGLSGRFNSYGMDGYYNRYLYSIGIAVSPIDSLAVSLEGNYYREIFIDINNFQRWELDTKIAYRKSRFSVAAGLSGITLAEDYEYKSARTLRPWGACSYNFENGITLWSSVRRFENNRTRWFFGQNLRLTSAMDLSVGLMNRPDLIYGRIAIKHGSIIVDLAYYSLNRLNDIILVGFGYGG
ncbi:MAG: hypothetical protein V3W18_14200 [candidate division Zixibacteria bacterium]